MGEIHGDEVVIICNHFTKYGTYDKMIHIIIEVDQLNKLLGEYTENWEITNSGLFRFFNNCNLQLRYNL